MHGTTMQHGVLFFHSNSNVLQINFPLLTIRKRRVSYWAIHTDNRLQWSFKFLITINQSNQLQSWTIRELITNFSTKSDILCHTGSVIFQYWSAETVRNGKETRELGSRLSSHQERSHIRIVAPESERKYSYCTSTSWDLYEKYELGFVLMTWHKNFKYFFLLYMAGILQTGTISHYHTA